MTKKDFEKSQRNVLALLIQGNPKGEIFTWDEVLSPGDEGKVLVSGVDWKGWV